MTCMFSDMGQAFSPASPLSGVHKELPSMPTFLLTSLGHLMFSNTPPQTLLASTHHPILEPHPHPASVPKSASVSYGCFLWAAVPKSHQPSGSNNRNSSAQSWRTGVEVKLCLISTLRLQGKARASHPCSSVTDILPLEELLFHMASPCMCLCPSPPPVSSMGFGATLHGQDLITLWGGR